MLSALDMLNLIESDLDRCKAFVKIAHKQAFINLKVILKLIPYPGTRIHNDL
jgi:hypothetical protein